MTVKELRDRLKDYPDDMPVVVEHFCVTVASDKLDDVDDFEILVPSIASEIPMSSKLFKDYTLTKTFLNTDETINTNPTEHYTEKSFYADSTIRFKPNKNCNIEICENYYEAVSVMGESNIAVQDMDFERIENHKFFDECLLIG